MPVRTINCLNCGAAVDWDGTYGKPLKCTYCGSTILPSATDVEEVWLMTDPVARARYEFKGELNKLEHDIRYEVLRGEDWTSIDYQYLAEMRRLEEEGRVRKLASFWSVSPHPPVYRAEAEGEIVLGSNRLRFQKGDEIIWACPMTRDVFELDLPVLIGDFQDTRLQMLCGMMESAMQGRMG